MCIVLLYTSLEKWNKDRYFDLFLSWQNQYRYTTDMQEIIGVMLSILHPYCWVNYSVTVMLYTEIRLYHYDLKGWSQYASFSSLSLQLVSDAPLYNYINIVWVTTRQGHLFKTHGQLIVNLEVGLPKIIP